MDETEINALRDAIKNLHGCDATYVEVVPVTEKFKGQVVWDGEVGVFELTGHPTAARCYAWSHATEGQKRRFYAVLQMGPVKDAANAVRAAIVGDSRRGVR